MNADLRARRRDVRWRNGDEGELRVAILECCHRSTKLGVALRGEPGFRRPRTHRRANRIGGRHALRASSVLLINKKTQHRRACRERGTGYGERDDDFEQRHTYSAPREGRCLPSRGA